MVVALILVKEKIYSQLICAALFVIVKPRTLIFTKLVLKMGKQVFHYNQIEPIGDI